MNANMMKTTSLGGPSEGRSWCNLYSNFEEWKNLVERAGEIILLKRLVNPGVFTWIDPNQDEIYIRIPDKGTLVIHHLNNPALSYTQELTYFVLVESIPIAQYAWGFDPIRTWGKRLRWE